MFATGPVAAKRPADNYDCWSEAPDIAQRQPGTDWRVRASGLEEIVLPELTRLGYSTFGHAYKIELIERDA
jgi:hypothetical protein